MTWYHCTSCDKSCTAAVSDSRGVAHCIVIMTVYCMHHVGPLNCGQFRIPFVAAFQNLQNAFHTIQTALQRLQDAFHILQTACQADADGQICALQYYTPAILELAGLRDNRTALLVAMLPAAVNSVGTLVGMWQIDKCGRRQAVVLITVFVIMVFIAVVIVTIMRFVSM